MAYKHGSYATVDTSRAKRIRTRPSHVVTPSTPGKPSGDANKVQFFLENEAVKLTGITFCMLEDSIQLAGTVFSLNNDQAIQLKGV